MFGTDWTFIFGCAIPLKSQGMHSCHDRGQFWRAENIIVKAEERKSERNNHWRKMKRGAMKRKWTDFKKCKKSGENSVVKDFCALYWDLMAFDNGAPLFPLSRCLYPGGKLGGLWCSAPGNYRGWLSPRLTHLRCSPEQSTVCRAEASGPTSGPLISNSSHGAGPQKRLKSNNNDCVMIWKWQQNLNWATKQQRYEGEGCPNLLGFPFSSRSKCVSSFVFSL